MKNVIAVDICNTLADINKELVEFFGVPLDAGTYNHPCVTGEWFLENLWIFKKAKPLEYSVEVLNEIGRYFDILYLTARPKEAIETTYDWLSMYGFPMGKIISSTNKAAVYKEKGCFLAIDDSPYEIENYLSNDCKVAVVSKDYNSAYNNRFTWKEAYKGFLIKQAV